jgi:hypothetical protein
MDTPTLVGTGFVITGLVVWIVCVLLAYQTAPKRGRRAGVWALLTVVFGPLALFALYLMKPMHGPGDGGSQAKQGQHHDPRADLYEVPKKH